MLVAPNFYVFFIYNFYIFLRLKRDAPKRGMITEVTSRELLVSTWNEPVLNSLRDYQVNKSKMLPDRNNVCLQANCQFY